MSIEPYGPPGSGKYLVRLYIPGGRRYKKVIYGKRNAQQHEAEMRLRLATGYQHNPNRTTLTTYAHTYITQRNLRPNTLSLYTRLINNHIAPHIGDTPLRQLTHTHIDTFQRHLFTHYGNTTAHRTMTLLRSILNNAVHDHLITHSPATNVTTPTQHRPTITLPTWQDLHDATSNTTTPQRTLLLAALAGLRAGEIAGLATTDHHHDHITINRQIQYLSPANDPNGVGGAFYAPPKTSESQRTIPIPPTLTSQLEHHRRYMLGCRPITLPEGHTQGPPATHRVYLNGSHANSVSQRGRKTLGHPIHHLRHLYTTTLANAGIPTHLIDAVTGHAAVGSTSRVIYTHITPEALATIPPVIEAAWQRT